MGLRVALGTSHNQEIIPEELTGIEIHNQAAAGTTTFKNIYTASGRQQVLVDKAADLDLNQLPESWLKAKIIHLAPVAREISLEIGNQFSHAALAYSLQGWLRDWAQDGRVRPVPLPDLVILAPKKSAAFLSIEDLGFERSQLDYLQETFPLFFLTRGSQGAELFQRGKLTSISTELIEELDPTGAGDIFAAAFIISWALKGKSILDSARFASALAAISVTRPGIEGVPTENEIQEILKMD